MYENSRRNLKTDVIDFYLLHSIGGGGANAMKVFEQRFVANGMLDFLVKERAAGRIRNLGFSFHGSEEVFLYALSLHEKIHWDFAQIQLNWVDWRHASTLNPRNLPAEKLYGWLTERKIPVVVMEPLLGGRLARLKTSIMNRLSAHEPGATAANWAFRFAGSHPNVLTVLSGMTYMRFIEENVRTYSPLAPLSPEAFQVLERAARQFLSDDSIGCTACNYCMPCPYGLDIPTLFSVWNAALTEDRFPDDPADPAYPAFRRKFLADYARHVPSLREAARCLGCGRCTPHCPQAIDIPAQIYRVDQLVERLRRNGRA
jgi:predicted aldo/keto reductase-like oxidoreductase